MNTGSMKLPPQPTESPMTTTTTCIAFREPTRAWVEERLRGLGCTQWQDLQQWIKDKRHDRMKLIQEASVHFPQPMGGAQATAPLSSISHYLTAERLQVAAQLLEEDTAAGFDGMKLPSFKKQTDFAKLATKVRSRRYRTSPLRRVEIKKQDGGIRPLGIPTVSDRVIQRAWLLILENAFDREFLDCSYGYRQGRGCHQALSEIAKELGTRKHVYALDADFTKFFDRVDHTLLMKLVEKRVTDPVFLKFCWDTLKSPVSIKGKLQSVLMGTPQGGVLSPLLANLFAHEALDLYYRNVVAPQLSGWSRLFRYADDFVVLTETAEDAELARTLIGDRVKEWGQELHPAKTHIRDLRCPGIHPIQGEEDDRSLLFLGYQIYWKQRGGRWEVAGRTAPGRVEKALEGWRKALEAIRAKAKHEGKAKATEALFWSILCHVKGFGAYYCADGNHPEIQRYESGVYREAAEFWRRYIDRRGANPFSDTKERIWETIQMRAMCRLVN